MKSNSDLIIEQVGDNQINLVGIENMDQYEFVVTIDLKSIDGADHYDDTIKLAYTLFDKRQSEHTRSATSKTFPIETQLTFRVRSSYNDLIVYFRSNFKVSVDVTPVKEDDHVLGKYNGLMGHVDILMKTFCSNRY